MGTQGCQVAGRQIQRMAESGTVLLTPLVRAHVDRCRSCWRLLVAARWTAAKGSEDLHELKCFLGKRFESGIDPSWALADEWNSRSRKTRTAVEEFYRNTPWYIYNLVLWKACGQRPDYVQRATPVLKQYGIQSVIDFGAGVGTDALQFAHMGLRTGVVELNEAAIQFLLWRAKRRGVTVTRMDSPPTKQESNFDLLWAVDVMEHLLEPVRTLTPYLVGSRLLIHDSEHKGKSGGRHPFHFKFNHIKLERAWKALGFVPDENNSRTIQMRVFASTQGIEAGRPR